MKKYMTSAVEWVARRILASGVRRAAQILDDMDESYKETPKALPAPKLPEIDYVH